MARTAQAIVLLGAPACTGGTYLLRIRLARGVRLAFGRFAAGRPLQLPAGDYAYVGSAMAQRGSASLARRLLRHATRTGRRRPHAVRVELARRLAEAGLLPGGPPAAARRAASPKRLRWHVDYLLDLGAAALQDIVVRRADVRLEARLAAWLAAQPGVRPVAPGLGAGDDPGQTHLLAVPADDAWWDALATQWAAGYLAERSAG